MSTNGPPDLESVWQRETDARAQPTLAELVGVARRGTFRMALVVATEVGITGLLAWFTVELLARPAGAFETAWLVSVWLGWAVSVRFVVRNRRGVWRAAGETTRDYLRLAETRALRKLDMVRFTVGLLIFQVGIVASLFVWGRVVGRPGLGSGLDIALLGGISVTYLVWAVWYRARARAELAQATALLAEFDADTTNGVRIEVGGAGV